MDLPTLTPQQIEDERKKAVAREIARVANMQAEIAGGRTMGFGSCETVRVKAEVTDDNPNGFIVINKTDFKEDEHELFVVPKSKKKVADDKPDFAAMKVAELKEYLDGKKVEYDKGAIKDVLIALCEANA